MLTLLISMKVVKKRGLELQKKKKLWFTFKVKYFWALTVKNPLRSEGNATNHLTEWRVKEHSGEFVWMTFNGMDIKAIQLRPIVCCVSSHFCLHLMKLASNPKLTNLAGEQRPKACCFLSLAVIKWKKKKIPRQVTASAFVCGCHNVCKCVCM